jgi:5-formyltetrahydrofolate cyclo-ligase
VSDQTADLKADARRRLRAVLAGVPDRAPKSVAVAARLLAWDRFRQAAVVMAFLPLPGEVDITEAASAVLLRGDRLCLPRVDWSTGIMSACQVKSLSDGLVVGRAGLREPSPGASSVRLDEIALVLVPGLGFDATGGRIGRGAGFYDRFLAPGADPSGRAGAACGVGFEAQVAERIPMGPMDIRLGAVVTEARLILPGDGPGAG